MAARPRGDEGRRKDERAGGKEIVVCYFADSDRHMYRELVFLMVRKNLYPAQEASGSEKGLKKSVDNEPAFILFFYFTSCIDFMLSTILIFKF